MKYKHKLGFCPVCGDQMFDVCNECHRPGQALPNQRQMMVMFDSGSCAWIGFCEQHIDEFNPEMADAIWQGIAEVTEAPPAKVVAVNRASLHKGSERQTAEPNEKLTLGNELYETNREGE